MPFFFFLRHFTCLKHCFAKENKSTKKQKKRELKCWNPPDIFDVKKQANKKDETNFENLPTLKRELSSQTYTFMEIMGKCLKFCVCFCYINACFYLWSLIRIFKDAQNWTKLPTHSYYKSIVFKWLHFPRAARKKSFVLIPRKWQICINLSKAIVFNFIDIPKVFLIKIINIFIILSF